ncbi:MAG TPA: alpha/beta fold hydrolase [Rhizomicrobium sp.]|nr:alpha/beta fold hydrolase [Rhizomicrobium sp.]
MSDAADLHPCPQLKTARCGVFNVFENREAGRGRKLSIAVAILPAIGPTRAEPIFWFSGGPGASAIEEAQFILGDRTRDIRSAHDIVFVDQRGTGSSNPLQCPPPRTPQGNFGYVEYEPHGLKACRAELERKADLTQYTTSIADDDIDDVRAWLGYDKIVLWGGSYGTKAAMVYMRRHPTHVAAAILDAVDSFGSKDPLYYAYGSQKGLERVFADCAAQRKCAKAFPALPQTFAKLLDSFRQGPRIAHIRTSAKAPSLSVRYSLGDFGYTVRGILYDADQTALLPSEISAAAASGNVDVFAQVYYDRAADLGQALAGGLYLSITCAEGVEAYEPGEVVRWTAGTFLGNYLVQDYQRACALWPRAKVPASYYQPLESDIPTLLFSGGRDPTTPVEFAKGVARHLSQSRHIVFPEGGHGNTGSDCGLRIVNAFLKAKSVKGLDVSCARAPSSQVPFAVPKT